MSQHIMTGTGNIDEIQRILTDAVVNSGLSSELVGRAARAPGGGQVRILVFEKYYMRSENRTSLTVVLTGEDDTITADIIGSGGGQGVFFRFSWGAEADFADSARSALLRLGFRNAP